MGYKSRHFKIIWEHFLGVEMCVYGCILYVDKNRKNRVWHKNACGFSSHNHFFIMLVCETSFVISFAWIHNFDPTINHVVLAIQYYSVWLIQNFGRNSASVQQLEHSKLPPPNIWIYATYGIPLIVGVWWALFAGHLDQSCVLNSLWLIMVLMVQSVQNLQHVLSILC